MQTISTMETKICTKRNNVKKEKKSYQWLQAFEEAQDGVSYINHAFFDLDPSYEIKQALDTIDVYLTNLEDTILIEDDE